MAGRNPHQAREAFLAPLRRALSCLTAAQFVYPPLEPGDEEALTTPEAPLRQARADGDPLNLTLRQRYRIVESEDPDRGPWKVSTVAYVYLLADMDGRELAAWHWHPGGPSSFTRPHLHVAGPLGSRCHLPTGRVSIEAIVRLLLEELNVTPKRDDWRQVLDEVEAVFARWRTWA